MGTIAGAGPGVGAGLAGRAVALGRSTWGDRCLGWCGGGCRVGGASRGAVVVPVQADVLALGTLVAPPVVTFAVMQALPRQATPGKALVSLRVQSVDGIG